ncbi:pyridoxamine 5'-phosphate oxidase family protein [Sulfurimonas sp. MAG313]|nr:pyridoxamine 5'-phosphate oxidase family protein [Sulfurimonas sp. MAG313]MDF1881225.1 pyridoxamine 5'-phosphate oxidase family protein [Sulfurimonas sp. MAG313]
MGKQYKELSHFDMNFIKEQKVFFIASCSSKEVNLSPRGYKSIYIQDSTTLYMIDYLGSGNRTQRDINEDGEITLMFTAFESKPKILRCFCKGACLDKDSNAFKEASLFFNEDMNAVRYILKFTLYAVESSCGMSVPLMQYQEDRTELREYALDMHKQGKFEDYVQEHKVPVNLKKL